MIKIEISKQTLKRQAGKGPPIYRHIVSISGHAGYHPGNDIVCAAVSALAHSLAAYIQQTLQKKIYDIKIQAVNARIIWRVQPDGREYQKINGAFNMLICGYQMLADTYPDNVMLQKTE